MSGKGNGVAHRVLDELHKYEAKINGKVAEVQNKHNELVAQLTAIEGMIRQVAGFTASETGKFQGQVQNQFAAVGRSLEGMDLNILAMAELLREVVGQFVQVDQLFHKLRAQANVAEDAIKLSDGEIETVKEMADKWYRELMASSFSKARERIAAQEAAQREQALKEERERQAAEAEAASKSEAAAVQTELKNAAEAERTIVQTMTGGPGTEFPEGAEIFGG